MMKKLDDLNPNKLRKAFKVAAKVDLGNKEIASLMGEITSENPNILQGGIISQLGFTHSKQVEFEAKKRKKAWLDWVFQEVIRQSLKRLEEIIGNLQNRISEILDRITETEIEIAELDAQHTIIKEEIQFYQENGFFDTDENGRLKNPKTENIIVEYERKTGQKIDCTDSACYGFILQILVDIDQRQATLKEVVKNDVIEYEFTQEQLETALEIKEGLNATDSIENQQSILELDKFISNYNSIINKDNRMTKPFFDNEETDLNKNGFDFEPLSDDSKQLSRNNSKETQKILSQTSEMYYANVSMLQL